MASTSTNKQPLLVDRVLHEVVDLQGATIASGSGIEVAGTNNASLVVDCTTNDGAIIEEVYSIARTITTGYQINLYLSSASDYLRTQQSIYIHKFTGSTTVGTKTTVTDLPSIIAPLPQTGNASQLKALYIPAGKALWAAVVAQSGTDQAQNAPFIGVQGGYY